MKSTTNVFRYMERPEARGAIAELVQATDHIEIAGGQTHGKLIPEDDKVTLIDMTAYRGITEYEPEEYVISAKAGTPLSEISAELKLHNQYLPFDPPDGSPDTTIGGVVATGWSGSGALRYGRLRDFILGVELLSGSGRWIKGGGKVVKNAAGFDLPKLVVGSLGCFGIIGNITLKVFPSPVSTVTLRGEFNDFGSCYEGYRRVVRTGMTLDGCVVEPNGNLIVQLGGLNASLGKRADTIRQIMESETKIIEGSEEQQLWNTYRNTGPGFGSGGRCKVPILPSEILRWQAHFSTKPYRYFYDQAGSILVIDLDKNMEMKELERHLDETARTALCTGMVGGPGLLGKLPDRVFIDRIRNALDPQGKFPDFNKRHVS